MKSAVCPKCFMKTTEEQWVYSCRRSECEMLDRALELSETVSDRNGQPACPGCEEPFASPLCPECGFPVCEDDTSMSVAVSIIGAQGSGKSHFISVLIDELKNRVAKVYDYSLFPLGGDATLSLYDRQYYKPLFVDGQCLEPSEQDSINPLIYSLVFGREREPKAVGLTLYDSCGDNFESITAMANYNRSIYYSGGILFFIEPSQLPVAAEWIASRGGNICEANPVSLLTRTIRLLRTGNAQKNLGKKLDIPVAVCLTKLDTVRPLLDVSSFLCAPPRHLREAAFDSVDFEACSLEARSLIEAWGGGELVGQITSQFSTYGFFALSALGGEPSSSGGVHHIAPHRVTDPILWLLHKNRVIK